MSAPLANATLLAERHASRSAADPLLAELQAIVGPAYAVAGEAAPDALVDQRRRYFGRARAVVRPGSTAEVAAVVRLLAAQGVPIVPQGGNTGLVGGATPDESGRAVVLSLTRLNALRALDLANDTITVEAGVVLGAVQDAARAAGRLFPLSLPSEGSCTIGGNLGTNAGGTQVLRYGNARDLTLGLEVVTAEGEVWNGLSGLRKDNSGYDLRDLYIGSEGTLGIITAATLRLFPLPATHRTAFLKVDDIAKVLKVLTRARAAFGARLTGFEMISGASYTLISQTLPQQPLPFAPEPEAERWYLLIELSETSDDAHGQDTLEAVLGAVLDEGLALDAVLATSLAQARGIWHLRESCLSQAQAVDGRNVKHDISIPISRIPDFVATARDLLQARFPGVRLLSHGHVGDGNLHYNVARPIDQPDSYVIDREDDIRLLVQDIAVGLGGSISAEHGIGRSKRDDLSRYKDPLELALMARLKAALDPAGLLNPGKVLKA